ncbi:hypothetical protein [Parabacteroides gordonii]|jgi:hypothetical protein|uniref:hypothetical protein n=1 Tax=Parabacteroides gordonii TaxID=574930 RepID=UPI00241EE84E|nr:hypothetical protein [Parabacteroides gordonii]
MRRIVTIMLLTCMTFIHANAAITAKDEVTLTVSADGANKDEAIKSALRSALEQTYGVFISSNTSLLNDELVKDEIVTVSSGNIKKYKELISEMLPNGRMYVTLQVTVSVSKLVTYAKSKGATVEFDGASLYMNIQMEKLNTKSQDEVLKNLAIQVKSLLYNGYDYSLKVLRIEGSRFKRGIEISLEVKASPNKNFKRAITLIHQTLKTLHVPTRKQVNTINYKPLSIIEKKAGSGLNLYTDMKAEKGYILRDSPGVNGWLASIKYCLNLAVCNYTIQDGTGLHSVLERPRIGERDYMYREYYRNLTGMKICTIGYNRYIDVDYIEIRTDKQYEEIHMIVDSDSELSKYNDFKIQRK